MFGISLRPAVAVLVISVLLLVAIPADAQGGWYTASVDAQAVKFTQGFGLQICGEGKPRAWSPNDPAGTSDFKSIDTGMYYHFDNLELQDYGASGAFSGWVRLGPSTHHDGISGCPSAPAPAPSAPPSISLSADQSSITAGQCATLRWDVDNVRAVYLDGQGVTGHDSKSVCPLSTTTYTLRVVTDNGDVFQSTTVQVSLDLGSTSSDPSAQLDAQLGEFKPIMTDADYASLKEFLQYLTDAAPCIAVLHGWKVAHIIIATPDDAQACGGMITEIANVMDKYIQPVPVGGDNESMDLGSYCANKYSTGAYANMGDRWDAYSWTCVDANDQSYSIDMNDVCKEQHPEAPVAYMGSRQDAYSWVCGQ